MYIEGRETVTLGCAW